MGKKKNDLLKDLIVSHTEKLYELIMLNLRHPNIVVCDKCFRDELEAIATNTLTSLLSQLKEKK